MEWDAGGRTILTKVKPTETTILFEYTASASSLKEADDNEQAWAVMTSISVEIYRHLGGIVVR